MIFVSAIQNIAMVGETAMEIGVPALSKFMISWPTSQQEDGGVIEKWHWADT